MKRQIEMERTMQVAHRDFIDKLEQSIAMIEKDIEQAYDIQKVCTDEWCNQTEYMVDELHKFVYSISEPYWTSEEDSKRLRALRTKLHDLYGNYKQLTDH